MITSEPIEFGGELDLRPVTVLNAGGRSPFLLVSDHAGNDVPSSLGKLGLSDDELSRHIAIDIGVAGLGERLAERLDAVLIRQNISRLVFDCNRWPEADDAIPEISDGLQIPGNSTVTADDRAARAAAVSDPYHRTIGEELDRRQAAGHDAILVSLHSFTPSLRSEGFFRPWHVGVLHERGETDFAVGLLGELRRDPDLTVGDNEPYSMRGGCTIPRHAYPRGIRYVLIEVRQDLLLAGADQHEWGSRLASTLCAALEGLGS